MIDPDCDCDSDTDTDPESHDNKPRFNGRLNFVELSQAMPSRRGRLPWTELIQGSTLRTSNNFEVMVTVTGISAPNAGFRRSTFLPVFPCAGIAVMYN